MRFQLGRIMTCVVLLATSGASRAGAQATVDHSRYDALLRKHVHDGLVDYDAFQNDTAFSRYLKSLAAVDPSLLDQNERLAFWINSYNAFTIQLINEHHERESIRNIRRTLGVLRLKGPWTTPVVNAGGRVATLDDVQYRLIRRESSDPRLHFVLACGAKGCPPLRSEAYTGAQLEEQLEDQARTFIRSAQWNRVDLQKHEFHAHPILQWFRRDFGDTWKEFYAFVARYQVESVAAQLTSQRFRYIEKPFDWSLNIVNSRASN